jgi:hypothetical protein
MNVSPEALAVQTYTPNVVFCVPHFCTIEILLQINVIMVQPTFYVLIRTT